MKYPQKMLYSLFKGSKGRKIFQIPDVMAEKGIISGSQTEGILKLPSHSQNGLFKKKVHFYG
ncbi:unnamed protein product, partial [marine sediment metagenome]